MNKLTAEKKIQLIKEIHENPLGGHLRITGKLNKFYAEHYWKGMRKQIKQYVKQCTMCQRNKIAKYSSML
ncbi:Hypothetical protein CINCED_3A020343 [Cinara cedri]|uniref:Integrase zinc-binding domain-containing protein n=1 Tax=Cinara cedri TaxID=506608 RepID=A0A5E4MU97_9HEMI|nr:Hypothetical protein CINCED_3A020343 [Cinara cedri]